MKFLINSDCLISGQHTAEGTVVTVTDDQAVELMLANRGRVVPEDYAAPAEVPTDEPAEVPTDEPAEVPTDEPAEVPTDEPAKAAKPTKK